MASAHFSSQACLTLSDTERNVYAGIDIVTSLLGITGALYQVLTWRATLKRLPNYTLMGSSQAGRPTDVKRFSAATKPSIIFCLAAADILSCLAVLAKSIELIAISRPRVLLRDECVYLREDYYIYFDSPISIVGIFAYLSSFMWTFCYALDVYLQLKKLTVPLASYHVLCWGTAAVITIFKSVIIGLRDSNPPVDSSCYPLHPNGRNCVLPSGISTAVYLAFFLPIVFTMLACPILFLLSLPKIHQMQIGSARMLTGQQRKGYHSIARKFFLIVFFFWICWIFNGINGLYFLVIQTSRGDSPFVFYVLEALTNPMQGFFNAFVFGQHQETKQWLCRNQVDSNEKEDLFTSSSLSDN